MGKRKRSGGSKRSSRKRSRKSKKSSRRKYLPLTGFPKTKLVKLRYVYEFFLENPGPVPLTDAKSLCTTFVANGADKPWALGYTHQPKGYDEWMKVYNHFQVIGSKIRVKTTGLPQNVMWGVTRVAAGQQMTDMTLNELLEVRFQKKSGTVTGALTSLNTPINRTQTASFSSKKQFGKNSTNNEELTGTQGNGTIDGNPAEKTFFDVWQIPTLPAGAMTSRKGYYVATIDYLCLLTEPKVLAQS